MTIEEYKDEILHLLEKAKDCEEVEQIISRSLLVLRSKHLRLEVILYYLQDLKMDLRHLSKDDFDPIHWCNIRCAEGVLTKMSSPN